MAEKLKPLSAGWLLAIIYAVGVAGFLFTQTRPIMIQLVWVNLLLTMLTLLAYHKKWTREFVLAALMVGACGFLIEVLGVNTGWIFGYYQYGPTLGYDIWNTPLMMFVNWLTTVYITRQTAELMAKDTVLVCFIASALMVLLDYFIEPFAIKNGMWLWNGVDVPVQNYVAWLVFGFILQYLFAKAVKFPTNKLSLPVYLIQLAFFVALYLFQK
ncbi:MAG: carotenoid biosynthesis protein [Bacteroidetes bacterium]|nr:carotenoid biosynthesis protein [Bacteroidota bacterium]